MNLDVIGFGSLNLDEFWEVPDHFLRSLNIEPGHEYVKDLGWFQDVYPRLKICGSLKAIDPGGSAANMIAALRRMGFCTGFFGATGHDGLDRMRIQELGRHENLLIDVVEAPAGRCLCLINVEDEHRDRCLVILPNANDLAGSRGFDKTHFSSTKWLHMTSFVSRSPLQVQKALAMNLPISTKLSFDPGIVYSGLGLDELRPILQRSDVLFSTEEELFALTCSRDSEKASHELIQMGVGIVILKLGSRGITAMTRSETIFQDSIRPANVVDRTGAGDVAAAGFIAGLLKELSLAECLELAARTASKSIEGYGRSAYPDRDFIGRFLKSCA